MFGDRQEPAGNSNVDGEPHAGALKAARHGDIGEWLTHIDLVFRGFEAAVQRGVNTDVNVEINGIYRRLQVKSSKGTTFAPGGRGGLGATSGRGHTIDRPLCEYRGLIDGFAFVHLPLRAVYYMHINAVAEDERGITIQNFSRQCCDMSWAEVLRRWTA